MALRRAGAVWHAGRMIPDDVAALVPEWLPLPDVAERLGRSVTVVRRLIDDGELVALRVGERSILSVPAAFLDDDGPMPALKGTLTVLDDGGMDDVEKVRWLFTPDQTLPGGGGTPVDAIRAGFKKEVRRRAMELAF